MSTEKGMEIIRFLSKRSGSVRPLKTQPTLRFWRYPSKGKNHTRQPLKTPVRQPTALPPDQTAPLVSPLSAPGRSLPARRTQAKRMLALVETRAVSPESAELSLNAGRQGKRIDVAPTRLGVASFEKRPCGSCGSFSQILHQNPTQFLERAMGANADSGFCHC